MTILGIIGAGHIGSQVARAALSNGYDVVISNSRGPESLRDLVAELGDGATAATATDAAERGDLVVVTVPMAAIATIPVEPLAGKVVIDTNNYYWERDGRIAAIEDQEQTVSGLLQERLPQSKVVKAFNNIGFGDITTTGSPAGTPNRRALPIAGDDADAKSVVTNLLGEFGFDVVDTGPLSESWRQDRDTLAYVSRQNSDELTANLAAAVRGGNKGTKHPEQ